MDTLKLALVQANLVWENTFSNIQKFDDLLTSIDVDTHVIVLPEMFTTGFSMKSENLAENMDGQSVLWMKSRADERNCRILGSLIIKEGGSFFNRMISVGPKGEIAYYDKKHLFKLSGEHNHYKSGEKREIVNVGAWKLCPLICYDLRFPEWARNRNEYDILIYSANWPKTRAEHWRSLLKARAIENQCFVLGVNRVGEDGNGLQYQGHTSAYDYKGELLDEIVSEQGIIHVELDKRELKKYRIKFPFLDDQDGIVK